MQILKELIVCVALGALFLFMMLLLICESLADVVYLLTGWVA